MSSLCRVKSTIPAKEQSGVRVMMRRFSRRVGCPYSNAFSMVLERGRLLRRVATVSGPLSLDISSPPGNSWRPSSRTLCRKFDAAWSCVSRSPQSGQSSEELTLSTLCPVAETSRDTADDLGASEPLHLAEPKSNQKRYRKRNRSRLLASPGNHRPRLFCKVLARTPLENQSVH
jgi:hypothetical protein